MSEVGRGGEGWWGSIHKAGDEPGWGGVVRGRRGGVKDLKGGYGRGFVRVVVFRVAVA